MKEVERIHAFGHENVLCTHKSTIEITKHKSLTKKGDCIIGVNASKACIDLTSELKKHINNEKKITVILKVGNKKDCFYGFGNKKLRLLDKNNMVFRKSNFICERTILINCSKSSFELNRDLTQSLKNPKTKLLISFEVDER
ncbi:MAG: DUF371 domain-containing protein [Candidatus Thorarchaeota archaeon]